jgi:hypothetical protein
LVPPFVAEEADFRGPRPPALEFLLRNVVADEAPLCVFAARLDGEGIEHDRIGVHDRLNFDFLLENVIAAYSIARLKYPSPQTTWYLPASSRAKSAFEFLKIERMSPSRIAAISLVPALSGKTRISVSFMRRLPTSCAMKATSRLNVSTGFFCVLAALLRRPDPIGFRP